MLLYYCGYLSLDKIVPSFTEVKPTDTNLQITSVLSIQKNIIALDSFPDRRHFYFIESKCIYEWKILSDEKLKTAKEGVDYHFIVAHFSPSKPLNDLFFDKEGSIIDIKNTKSELYVLDEKCTVSSLKLNVEMKANIGFNILGKNLIPQNKVVKICCGTSHCIALSNKGVVFSWGASGNGRLGQGTTADIANPQLMCHLLTYNIIDISSGLTHNIALGFEKSTNTAFQDKKLQLITWGGGSKGALGLGSNEDIFIPVANDFFNHSSIKEAHCGYSHTVVLTSEGDVYTYGSNEYGQLGLETAEDAKKPEKMAFEQKFLLNESGTLQSPRIARISVGPCHNFAISEDGEIYSWGLGSYGQLGNGKFSLKQLSPVIINDADEAEASNITAINFPKDQVRKFLSNLVITPAFDCTFMLINKRFKESGLGESKLLNESVRNSVRAVEERDKGHGEINDPMGRTTFDQSLSYMTNKESSRGDDHIINNILNFVSSHMPNMKIDKYYTSGTITDYSKEDEELHKRLIENTQKDYYNKIKEMDAKEVRESLFYQWKKMEKRNQDKKEKMKAKIKETWLKEMLPYWHYKKRTNDMRDLWRKGLPPSLRDQIWTLAIGNRLSITKKYYEIHLNKAKKVRAMIKDKTETQIKQIFIDQFGTDQSKENTLRLIELDLPRTFPSLAIFNNKDSPIYENLQNVLDAFVVSRPDIGYVQGMSFIAGLLLLYMQPYDAFRCFSNIVCKLSLIPFYLVDEQQINNRMAMFKIIMEANMPDLCDHFEKERIQPQSYLFKWLLTIYTNVINLDSASRLWDLFFLDGDIILYKAAIALLKLKQEELLEKDFEGILKIIANMHEFIVDDDLLTDEIYKINIPTWVLEEFDKFTYEFTP